MLLLEQSRSPEELLDAARQLLALLPPSDDQSRKELRRVFADWVQVLRQRLAAGEQAPEARVERTLEEETMSLADRVATWRREPFRQGIEQGVREGQRALLRRQAAARFGDATAERLFARLRREESPERLAEVGEAIVRCETGEDLLRSAGA